MGHQYILDSRADASKQGARSRRAADGPARPALFDKAFALAVLVGFAPLLAVLSLLIALGGRFPIFCQERVGYKGRPFCIFKFRTMPDEGWKAARAHARTNVTAAIQLAIFRQVSAILRNTGLDELPQFANILRGDMQIIGPRPLMRSDFEALPDRRLERCSVLPGITGLAQINGGQDLDSDSKLALDLYLIAHSSRGIAAKIVLRTVLRILGFSSATAKANEADLASARAHMEGPRRVPTAIPAVKATRVRHPRVDTRRGPAPDAARISPRRRPRGFRLVSLPVLFRKTSDTRPPDLDGASRSTP